MSRVELQVGESVQGRVTPGLVGCDNSTIVSVTWGIEDTSVASVTPLGPRNPAQETAGSIARAWVSGLVPGSTRVTAQVVARNSAVHEVQAAMVTVVERGDPPRGSIIAAEGTAEVHVNEFTGQGASALIPVELPRAGRVDVTVDWTSLRINLGFSLWEGTCLEVPCPGELVINAPSSGPSRPRRETVADLPAGKYTLRIFGTTLVGSASEMARYEIRLTPH